MPICVGGSGVWTPSCIWVLKFEPTLANGIDLDPIGLLPSMAKDRMYAIIAMHAMRFK